MATVIKKFIRGSPNVTPNGSPTHRNGLLSSDTSEHSPVISHRRQRGRGPIPPPLQLGDQSDSNTNGVTVVSAVRRENQSLERRTNKRLSRKMSDTASQFPFYHSYLTEEQEEDVFKDHLYKTGSFLMRDSKSNSRAVTMSVVIDPLHLYHFQVVQSDTCYHVVGKDKQFSTLDELIRHYEHNNIPGKTDEPVYLKHPVVSKDRRGSAASIENGRITPSVTSLNRPRNLPPSPPSPRSESIALGVMIPRQRSLDPIMEPTLDPPPPQVIYQNAGVTDPSPAGPAAAAEGACGGADILTNRPPMPIPRPSESDYASSRHIYSEADHPDLDRIKMVMELCKQSDMMHASRKKCTCGLYLEESTLTRGWMMHVDNEPGKTQGRIFFLDTRSNTTTWTLPEEVENELKNHYPVKWQFVQKQMANTISRASRRSSSST